MTRISVGDVVKLRSGGPSMTVEAIGPDWIRVVWFERDVLIVRQLQSSMIELVTLRPATTEPS